MSYCPHCAQLESENARLMGIIDVIDKAEKENTNDHVAMHMIRKIINEAKGEGIKN